MGREGEAALGLQEGEEAEKINSGESWDQWDPVLGQFWFSCFPLWKQRDRAGLNFQGKEGRKA